MVNRTGEWSIAALLAAALGVVATCLLAGPAAAHTDFIAMDPADGARLQQVPRPLPTMVTRSNGDNGEGGRS